MQGYFYSDAYVRTSGKKYSTDNVSDRETHLTNDAVQKFSKSYGKFENGNKLSLTEWQETIKLDYPSAPPNVVFDKIFPEIKELSKLSLAAAADKLIQTDVRNSFELFGYDYMVDETFTPVLIEVNDNPCLEFACPMLEILIAELIGSTIRVAVDRGGLPPPCGDNRTRACEEALKAIEEQEIKFDHFFSHSSTLSNPASAPSTSSMSMSPSTSSETKGSVVMHSVSR
jgi:hypothetical protein